MINFKKLAGGVAFVAMSAALTPVAFAQVTTSGVNGSVTKADGTAAGDATVTVEDSRTGLTRSVMTTPTGAFDIRGLNVGGPYTVTVTAPGQQSTQVTDVYLNLGASTGVNLAFSGSTSSDVVVITATQARATPIAIGPASVFSAEDLAEKPAINRDIKDIIRNDPRIYLDQTAGGPVGTDGVQCAGASPRFNSVSVDGIGLNDGFGLNNNGYPTERLPFPFDAVSQVSVELAPFDPQYGGFTGCAINMVSKSGTNDWSGSVFFDFTNNDMRGDTIEGRNVFVPEFEEKRYGLTFGGPIIEDTLFFFGAYERFEGVNLFGRGPVGSGATTEVSGFTQAEYQQIIDIARDVYGIDDLGGTPTSDPSIDEKYLARIDWNINDRHRAALTYNYNKGLNLTESDTGSSNFEYGNHLYDRGAELKAYSAQVFSDWSDEFSTALRVSYNDVNATVACRDGGNIGEVRITVDAGRSAYFGCDDSRHFNDLDYTVLTVKASGTYQLGDHTLGFGAERQTYDIFNAFTQHTEGEFVFSSIGDFQAGLANQIFYGNAAGTNNPDDTAASFKYDINTVYLQDEFPVGDSADVTLGLRYDWYTNSDLPRRNQFFANRNGFDNTENLDGKGILQPRFGFNWDIMDRLSLRGGAGLFAGGNPNVWVSNSYSNDGITAVQLQYGPGALPNMPLGWNILTNPNGQSERPGGQAVNPNNALWGIPQPMIDNVGTQAPNSAVAAIDPDFQPASEWKFSLGATYELDAGMVGLGFLGDGYRFDFDYIRGVTNNAATIVNAGLVRVGTAPDGSPLYKRADKSDPDCLNPATAPTAACATRTADDLLLTNAAEGGETNVYSIALSNSIEDWGIDWSLAYAHIDAKDTRSMTSSVAGSNFGSIAVSDINNPDQAKTNFLIPNRFTTNISWENEWFEDFTTRISLFGEHYQSRPYSYTFVGGGTVDTFGDNNEGLHLLYVPTGPNDPNVIFCGAPGVTTPLCNTSATNTTPLVFQTQAFFDWADSVGLQRGAQTSRNTFEGGWNNKFDLKLEQEFPTGFGKGTAFLVVENIGNLLNDEWGVLYETPFPQRVGVVEIDRNAATNQFVYRRLATPNIDDPVDGVSFWTVKVGATWGF